MPDKKPNHKKHRLQSSLMVQELLRKERDSVSSSKSTTPETKTIIQDIDMEDSSVAFETNKNSILSSESKPAETKANKINTTLLQERLKKQKALLSQHKTEKHLADMFLSPAENASKNSSGNSFNDFSSGYNAIDINKVNNMFKN
ncbi:hypothetical protein QEN19_003709 [Hanseniaspora menglaensis]